MQIKVTKKHIKNGAAGAYYNCPVALAIQEAIGKKDVSVCEGYVDIKDDWYWMPENATAWVEAFDAGKSVKPFAFELDI